MKEFDLIEQIFVDLTPEYDAVSLGIGDDAALLKVPPGHELAVSTDCLVAGRHFPLNTAACDIGWKSLAVNLSDLAAMGAHPLAFTLSLTLEYPSTDWLSGFAEGLACLARQQRISLIGGDTTHGPLNIGITVMGAIPNGLAMRRSNARTGDLICVTGTLGDAALALQQLQSGKAPAPQLEERLNRPVPRVSEGLALRGIANAAIDLSDGLAGDLDHVLRASGVGARVQLDQLPMSEAFAAFAPLDRYQLQAGSGDDYELCVCIPPDRHRAMSPTLRDALRVIGEVTRERDLIFEDNAGRQIDLAGQGFQHF